MGRLTSWASVTAVGVVVGACSSPAADPPGAPSGTSESSDSSAGTTSSGGSSAAPSVTFTDVYSQIISLKCTGCHVPGKIGVTDGMLDMSTQSLAYMDLYDAPAAGIECVGQGTRVVPGMPSMSILYLKVTQPPCGSQMPKGAAPLPPVSTDMIKNWIAEGAPND